MKKEDWLSHEVINLEQDKQIDKFFDEIEKKVNYENQEKKHLFDSLKVYDMKGYFEGVKNFYKNLIKTHKIEHNDVMAASICSHLFALSAILQLSEKYKKDNVLTGYLTESMKLTAKITLEVLRKEKVMTEEEYTQQMKTLKTFNQ